MSNTIVIDPDKYSNVSSTNGNSDSNYNNNGIGNVCVKKRANGNAFVGYPYADEMKSSYEFINEIAMLMKNIEYKKLNSQKNKNNYLKTLISLRIFNVFFDNKSRVRTMINMLELDAGHYTGYVVIDMSNVISSGGDRKMAKADYMYALEVIGEVAQRYPTLMFVIVAGVNRDRNSQKNFGIDDLEVFDKYVNLLSVTIDYNLLEKECNNAESFFVKYAIVPQHGNEADDMLLCCIAVFLMRMGKEVEIMSNDRYNWLNVTKLGKEFKYELLKRRVFVDRKFQISVCSRGHDICKGNLLNVKSEIVMGHNARKYRNVKGGKRKSGVKKLGKKK